MKNWKAILFVAFEILSVIGIFFFWINSENDRYSVTTQKIFPWIAGLCVVLFIGGIVVFNNARKKW